MTIASPMLLSDARAERDRVALLGMGIDRLSRAEVATMLDRFVRDGRAHQVVTVNLDFLSIGTRNSSFRRLVNEADLAVPDGQPLLWAARYLGGSLRERVTGLDLIEMAVEHSIEHGSRLFFLGAAPGVAAGAADALRDRFGEFHLAGAYSPPFGVLDGHEDERIRSLIRDARPDFLFVAFGCPKQDFWIRDHMDLGVPVAVGVGGSFDLLSGRIRRAPRWAQRSGFEWAFRLYREPRRLAKRYLVDDVQVMGRLILSRFSGTHEAAHSGDGG
jgi:N-acetylglucosaminyldiphosphoundecaprenol N-acetyl-beta-D-mannosaminyltransferase